MAYRPQYGDNSSGVVPTVMATRHQTPPTAGYGYQGAQGADPFGSAPEFYPVQQQSLQPPPPPPHQQGYQAPYQQQQSQQQQQQQQQHYVPAGAASSSLSGGYTAGAHDNMQHFFHPSPATSAGAAAMGGRSGSAGLFDGSSAVAGPRGGTPGGSASYAPSEAHRHRFGYPEDDLPLLEELGIYPRHILAKATAVLNPMKSMGADVIEDIDLAGPICFAVLLGFLLSLQGKVQFGAIYGHSLLGILFAKMLISLMSDQTVSFQFVVSTLGYCLLPNLVLAILQSFQYWLVGSHRVILPVALAVIAWSAWCATQMFVRALMMEQQRYLLLYPCVLFYAVFAALTIF